LDGHNPKYELPSTVGTGKLTLLPFIRPITTTGTIGVLALFPPPLFDNGYEEKPLILGRPCQMGEMKDI